MKKSHIKMLKKINKKKMKELKKMISKIVDKKNERSKINREWFDRFFGGNDPGGMLG